MVIPSGLGSLPGTQMGAAVRMTFDKLPELPYLPELPDRGPAAGMLGRGLAVASGIPADLDAGGWRLGSAGMDQRRARALLRDDLDILEENVTGWDGLLKVQIAGPWTLAASTAMASGGQVLSDPGARLELAAALAEGVGELLGDLRRRFPAAGLILQLDEPSLPAVLSGGVPTAGGFFRQRRIDIAEAVRGLALVTGQAVSGDQRVETVLHCCAAGLPLRPLLDATVDSAGFDGVSLDTAVLGRLDYDGLAWAAEQGRRLWLGCLPTRLPLPEVGALRTSVLRLIDAVGLGSAGESLVLTPACGLAGFDAMSCSAAFDLLATLASQVSEELAGSAG